MLATTKLNKTYIEYIEYDEGSIEAETEPDSVSGVIKTTHIMEVIRSLYNHRCEFTGTAKEGYKKSLWWAISKL